MGILRVSLVGENIGFLRAVFGAEKLRNQLAGGCHSLFRQPGGVRSHIGNQTGRTFADGNAFIQLLGHHHRAAGREIQFMGSFLLQGAGGKRRQRAAGYRLAERSFHFIGGLFQVSFYRHGFLGVMHFQLQAVFLGCFCIKQRSFGFFTKLCPDGPELFRNKFVNLLITVSNDFYRYGLYAARA